MNRTTIRVNEERIYEIVLLLKSGLPQPHIAVGTARGDTAARQLKQQWEQAFCEELSSTAPPPNALPSAEPF